MTIRFSGCGGPIANQTATAMSAETTMHCKAVRLIGSIPTI
jgi:hypothetical protein